MYIYKNISKVQPHPQTMDIPHDRRVHEINFNLQKIGM